MKIKIITIFLVVLSALILSTSCKEGTVNPRDDGSDSDSDADNDTDADTDDAGTDSDSDTDTDTGECVDPVEGAPEVTSLWENTITPEAYDGAYRLTFSEAVLGVDDTNISWNGPSTGGIMTTITQVDEQNFDVAYTGLEENKNYYITIGTGVTDLCGTPLADEVLIELSTEPLTCPLPNSYTTDIPFSTTYTHNESCLSSNSSYKVWDLSSLGATALCISGTFGTESCCDDFYVKDGSGLTVFSSGGSGSFNQMVDGDTATTCISSDGSIVSTGYTVTEITYY